MLLNLNSALPARRCVGPASRRSVASLSEDVGSFIGRIVVFVLVS
jgi:hypothetical protein